MLGRKYIGTPPYDHSVETITPVLRPLLYGPSKSPHILLSENPVNTTKDHLLKCSVLIFLYKITPVNTTG